MFPSCIGPDSRFTFLFLDPWKGPSTALETLSTYRSGRCWRCAVRRSRTAASGSSPAAAPPGAWTRPRRGRVGLTVGGSCSAPQAPDPASPLLQLPADPISFWSSRTLTSPKMLNTRRCSTHVWKHAWESFPREFISVEVISLLLENYSLFCLLIQTA